MIQLKLRPIGNSLGVLLPREALSRLKVGEGDALYLTEAPDGSLRLTPYDPAFAEQMQAGEEAMADYRNALRALAK